MDAASGCRTRWTTAAPTATARAARSTGWSSSGSVWCAWRVRPGSAPIARPPRSRSHRAPDGDDDGDERHQGEPTEQPCGSALLGRHRGLLGDVGALAAEGVRGCHRDAQAEVRRGRRELLVLRARPRRGLSQRERVHAAHRAMPIHGRRGAQHPAGLDPGERPQRRLSCGGQPGAGLGRRAHRFLPINSAATAAVVTIHGWCWNANSTCAYSWSRADPHSGERHPDQRCSDSGLDGEPLRCPDGDRAAGRDQRDGGSDRPAHLGRPEVAGAEVARATARDRWAPAAPAGGCGGSPRRSARREQFGGRVPQPRDHGRRQAGRGDVEDAHRPVAPRGREGAHRDQARRDTRQGLPGHGASGGRQPGGGHRCSWRARSR